MTSDGLRAFVDDVQRDMGQLQGASTQDPADVARVAASWKKLVNFLALGPAPELRQCPHCGATGMREATLCGYCWRKLVPPGAHAEARG